MNQPSTAAAENTPQEAEAATLADELIGLALENSAPVTCACGASWNLQRALDVAVRWAATGEKGRS